MHQAIDYPSAITDDLTPFRGSNMYLFRYSVSAMDLYVYVMHVGAFAAKQPFIYHLIALRL